MEVQFLYTQECPSHEEALARLQEALDAEGVAADIEVIRVESFDEAQRLCYPGSPTILINRHDISPAESSHYAPTCRAYLLEDGRISPLPSVSMIRKAIQQAKKELKPT